MNDTGENVAEEIINTSYIGAENEEKENPYPYPAGSRELIEQLLEISEIENLSFYNKPIAPDDWNEAVSGWKASPPYPKYVQSSRKRKPRENSDMYGIVRCVNDDNSDHHLKFWRATVEPITFRYVPNNALYRLNKFTQIDGEWYTVRKIKPEKVLSGIEHSPKNNRESRCRKRVPHKRSEGRSQSTNSDGALTQRATKVKNLLPYHPELLKKSASDLFMENLDSKLNQVENHVKQNMQNNKHLIKQSNEHLFRPKTKNMVVSFEVLDINNDACSVSSTASKTLGPLEKVTPKQRMKSVGLSKDDVAKNICDSPKINVDSSIVFEGVQSQHVSNTDNIQNDSYLIGKGNIMNSSKSPINVPVKKKGAILKYTTASSSKLKTKNNLWDQSQGTSGNDLVSGFMGDLPEVSGKQIPVSFSSQRLFRQ